MPGAHGRRPPVLLPTSPARGHRQAAITHPELLARLLEAEDRVSTGNLDAVSPAAEALALLRAITTELSGRDARREAAKSIPRPVLDDAVLAIAAQMGRLYEYHESQMNEETTSISWDSDGPEVSVLRDPV